jgi:MerR family transcriptional regulator, light-induced transcriptional regulator
MLTGKYSIKDLERLTGIKAHTIRIWEQRYRILRPERTDTHIRVYDDEELKKILKVSFLNKNGYKISKIARFSDEQLSENISKIETTGSGLNSRLDVLINAMLQFDEEKIYEVIGKNIEHCGFESCFEELLLPVLHNVGLLWQTNTIEPVHEHFLAGIIENILQTQISQLPKLTGEYKVILLQLTGDTHEMSLLYVHYLFRKYKVPLLYLGVSVPPSDIRVFTEKRTNLSIYVHSVLNFNPVFETSLLKLIDYAGTNKIFLSGKAAEHFTHPAVTIVSSLEYLKFMLKNNLIMQEG